MDEPVKCLVVGTVADASLFTSKISSVIEKNGNFDFIVILSLNVGITELECPPVKNVFAVKTSPALTENSTVTLLKENKIIEFNGISLMYCTDTQYLTDVDILFSPFLQSGVTAAAAYHFSTSFKDEGTDGGGIVLDEVGNDCGKKWIQALSIQPKYTSKRRLPVHESNEREPAKSETSKKPTPSKSYICHKCNQPGHYISDCTAVSSSSKQYVCKICNVPGHNIRDCPSKSSSQNLQGSCWFCLANPRAEKHLIVAIGDHCYVAFAKGPLRQYHLLIVPIQHYGLNATEMPDDVLLEQSKFKSAIGAMLQGLGLDYVFVSAKQPDMDWHTTVSVIPIEQTLSIPDLIEFYKKEASNKKMQLSDEETESFLKFQFSNGTDLLFNTVGCLPDLQFGRRVFCDFIKRPELANWKYCVLSRNAEVQSCTEVKNSFKAFDFTS